MKFVKITILILLSVGFGCASLEEDPTKDWTAEQLYYAAKTDLDARFYDRALGLYEKLNIRYPFGVFASQAKIETAYAYWKKGDNAAALVACDRFLREHPDHQSSDYVYYLKSLIYFNDDPGIFKRLVDPADLAGRDPAELRSAFFTLKELSARFPKSKYLDDALLRMQFLVEVLASHELVVGEHYYRIGAYVASINRAKFVLTEYPDSTYIIEALKLLSKSYDAAGLRDLRDKTNEIISLNSSDISNVLKSDPDKSWYEFWKDSGEGLRKPDAAAWWKFWESDTPLQPDSLTK